MRVASTRQQVMNAALVLLLTASCVGSGYWATKATREDARRLEMHDLCNLAANDNPVFREEVLSRGLMTKDEWTELRRAISSQRGPQLGMGLCAFFAFGCLEERQTVTGTTETWICSSAQPGLRWLDVSCRVHTFEAGRLTEVHPCN